LLRLLATQRVQARRGHKPRLTKTHLVSSDGRCVQAPGEYSPRHNEPRLLRIPYSRGCLQTSILTVTGFGGWLRLSTLHLIVPAIATRVWPPAYGAYRPNLDDTFIRLCACDLTIVPDLS